MKTITGKQAYELLLEAEAYILEDGNSALMYGSPEEENEGEYSLMLEYWYEGLGYEYTFYWTVEDEITVDKNQIFLKEEENENAIGIKLLQVKQL